MGIINLKSFALNVPVFSILLRNQIVSGFKLEDVIDGKKELALPKP